MRRPQPPRKAGYTGGSVYLDLSVWLGGERWIQMRGSRDMIWPISHFKIGRKAGVLALAVGQSVRLLSLPPTTPCRQAQCSWPPAPLMGGTHQLAIHMALRLAEAVVSGNQMIIEYAKKGEAVGSPRYISRIVPSPNGESIMASDDVKMAPRQFRLDRIGAVRRPEKRRS